MGTDEQAGSGIEIEKDLGVLGARRAVGVEGPEKRMRYKDASGRDADLETTELGNDCPSRLLGTAIPKGVSQ